MAVAVLSSFVTMFGMTSKEQCQPTKHHRQSSNGKTPVHFGQSYDYFERHGSLLLSDDDLGSKQKQRLGKWARGGDAVFCNVNALECDQDLPNDKKKRRGDSHPRSETEKPRFAVTNSATHTTGNSWPLRDPHNPRSSDLRETHTNLLGSDSPQQLGCTKTRHLPPSPRTDYHPSPTTPDEGYSTGTNSTTSISSPLSASLASIAFFDAYHNQGVSVGSQRAVTTNSAFDTQDPINRQNQSGSNNRSPYFPSPTREHSSLGDRNSRWEGENTAENPQYSPQTALSYSPSPSAMMQRGPIQKGPSLHQFGRRAISAPSIPAIKRRDVANPLQRDPSRNISVVNSSNTAAEGGHSMSSLEERLRALTTIEEEDSGSVDKQAHNQQQQVFPHTGFNKHPPHGYRKTMGNYSQNGQSIAPQPPSLPMQTRGGQRDNDGQNTELVESTGFFRAVPVQILQAAANSNPRTGGSNVRFNESQFEDHTGAAHHTGIIPHYSQHHSQNLPGHINTDTYNVPSRSGNSQTSPQVTHPQGIANRPALHDDNSPMPVGSVQRGLGSPSDNAQSWLNYQQYFQKEVDIPAHNIDPSRKEKFSNADSNRIPNMDINNHLNKNGKHVSAERNLSRAGNRHRECNERDSTLSYSSSRWNPPGESDITAKTFGVKSSDPNISLSTTSNVTHHNMTATNHDTSVHGYNRSSQSFPQNPQPQSYPISYSEDGNTLPSRNETSISDQRQALDEHVQYYNLNVANSMPDLRMQQQPYSTHNHRSQRSLLNSAPPPTTYEAVEPNLHPRHSHDVTSSVIQNIHQTYYLPPETNTIEPQIHHLDQHHQELRLNHSQRHDTNAVFTTDPSLSLTQHNTASYQVEQPQQLYQQQQQQQQQPPPHHHLQQGSLYPPQGISELQHDAAFEHQVSATEPMHQPDPDQVTMRRPHMSSGRTDSGQTGRYSWQPDVSINRIGLDGSNGALQRSSLDLGNLPQLQKQMRATSELCLQASRRHMFASSADIYKLFSSHRHRPSSSLGSPVSQHRNPVSISPGAGTDMSQPTGPSPQFGRGVSALRHSFHTTSSPSMYAAIGGRQRKSSSIHGSRNTENNVLYDQSNVADDRGNQHDLRFQQPLPLPSDSKLYPQQNMGSYTQVQSADRDNPNTNVPQNVNPHKYTSEHFVPSQENTNFVPPNSNSPFDSAQAIPLAASSQIAQDTQPPHIDQTHSEMFSELASGLEFDFLVPPIQRQSSGYSSETELQQIEYNARAVKKHFHHSKKVAKEHRAMPQPRNPTQEFIALNTSADHDSTTTAGTEESVPDEFVPIDAGNRRSVSAEPVYVNQMMMRRGAEDRRSQRAETQDDDVPPPLPARRPRPASVSDGAVSATLQSHFGHCRLSVSGRHHSTQAPLFFEGPSENEVKPSLNQNRLDSRTEFLPQQQLIYQPQQQQQLQQLYQQHQSRQSVSGDVIIKDDAPVFTQNQVINFQRRPVTITSHIPPSAFNQEHQSVEHNEHERLGSNTSQTFDNDRNIMSKSTDNNINPKWQTALNTHSSGQPYGNSSHNDSVSTSLTKPMSPNSDSIHDSFKPDRLQHLPGQHTKKKTKAKLTLPSPQNSSGSHKQDKPCVLISPASSASSASLPLSPVEVAQVLEVPFATNIISDEQGDRLSTLV